MKKISILLLLVFALSGCGSSATNKDVSQNLDGSVKESSQNTDSLVTDIKGEKNLGEDELTKLLKDKYGNLEVEYEVKYNEPLVTVTIKDEYIVDKTQEAVDKAVSDISMTMMEISQYIAVNYKCDDDDCRIDFIVKINGGEVQYYIRTSDLNYLEGENNDELLKSYLSKLDVLVTGKQDIINSIVNAFNTQFNVQPEHI